MINVFDLHKKMTTKCNDTETTEDEIYYKYKIKYLKL